MLTGDKEETAVNIGYSCNLILTKTKLFYLVKINSEEAYDDKLQEIADDIEVNCRPRDENGVGYRDTNGEFVEIAFVMDGPSFKYFDEGNKRQRKALISIGKASRSVIACRLTPLQKQQLVALVKNDTVPKATTLSIGDGANDVSMIREADVGVGIFGKEGRQAANNADFAIGQFKYLRRLLFIHGRYNYSRQSRVFLYSMHKNMVITLVLFWYK
jgi:magnesium-transporting ATPase (P-type)